MRRGYHPRLVKPRPGSPRWHRRTAVAAFALLAAACGDASPATGPPEPDAEAYRSVLATTLTTPADPVVEPVVVYLVALDGAVDIGTQASMIEAFADWYDIRFVDELAAAVDETDPALPPRDDAVIIGLGTIATEPPHQVRVEEYHSITDVGATLLTLTFDGDRWVVATTVPVPAEVLVDAT